MVILVLNQYHNDHCWRSAVRLSCQKHVACPIGEEWPKQGYFLDESHDQIKRMGPSHALTRRRACLQLWNDICTARSRCNGRGTLPTPLLPSSSSPPPQELHDEERRLRGTVAAPGGAVVRRDRDLGRTSVRPGLPASARVRPSVCWRAA